MHAMGRKLTLGCAALLCAASTTACGGDSGGNDSAGKASPVKSSSAAKPRPPKPHGPILRVDSSASNYTAQTVSAKLSYESPDGNAASSDSIYLEVVMVVKSALDHRPTTAPGSIQFEVKKPEWGDDTPTLEPATDYYTADQVNAKGEGQGAGVRATLGTLAADTPYYVTFVADTNADRDFNGSKLCGYPDPSPKCIPLEKPQPAAS